MSLHIITVKDLVPWSPQQWHWIVTCAKGSYELRTAAREQRAAFSQGGVSLDDVKRVADLEFTAANHERELLSLTGLMLSQLEDHV